jgi:beta-lactam-binding protein with PASTA domain
MIKLSSFKTVLSRSLWLAPFIFFLLGYFILDIFLHRSYIPTPNVLGLSLSEAITSLSSQNLNVRLLTSKEDEHVKEGTILNQNPSPDSSIRPQQTVFLVTSRKKEQPKTPLCIGKSYENVAAELKEQHISHTVYYVPSNHPLGTCIAQIPLPNNQLPSSPVILYVSEKSENFLMLLPSFIKCSVEETVHFLKNNDIPFSFFHTHLMSHNHTCEHCIILEQKPLAGSFIDIRTPPTIQLKIKG